MSTVEFGNLMPLEISDVVTFVNDDSWRESVQWAAETVGFCNNVGSTELSQLVKFESLGNTAGVCVCEKLAPSPL